MTVYIYIYIYIYTQCTLHSIDFTHTACDDLESAQQFEAICHCQSVTKLSHDNDNAAQCKVCGRV